MCVYEWRPRLTARPSLDQELRAVSDRGAAAEFAEDAVRSVVARLTEAPTNWHQSAPRDLAPTLPATSMQPPHSLYASSDLPGGPDGAGGGSHPRANVFFCALAPEDADALQRGCGLLAGVAMVALQSLVAMGVLFGTFRPACGSNDQCPQAGTFCGVGEDDRCTFCGESPLQEWYKTDPATGGVLNDPWAPDFAGFNLTAVAELCAGPSVYAALIVSWCKSGGDNALGRSIPRDVRGA